MHHEDATKFLIEKLRADPSAFLRQKGDTEFDVYIPRAVTLFLYDETGDQNLFDLEKCRNEKFWSTWEAFYDAVSDLCRRGILRMGRKRPMGFGQPPYELEERYSFTTVGLDWLKTATSRYIPTTPNRYLKGLENPGKVLGVGFLQRAGEAAGCHFSENFLACCAMCGAAAESALLAIADAKTGNPDAVQREYRKSGGRQNVTKLIFSTSQTSTLRNQFESAFNLLIYWRDEAAHGGPSTISQIQAYDALDRLSRLGFFAWDNWQELTGKPRNTGDEGRG